jgi:succinyl-CoA synthetase beta subunit
MKILENIAKGILWEHGIEIPESETANSELEAQKIVEKLKYPVMIKAIIDFGGRGKGHIPGTNLSGVEQADTPEQAYKIASEMLGKNLITTQTGTEGVIVNQVLIEQKISDIIQEFYLSVSILDGLPVIMVSKYGGMDIEKVDNRQIIKERISPLYGVDDDVQRKRLKGALSHKLKMDDFIISPLTEIALKVYQLFEDNDGTLIEINPLVLTKDKDFIALDAKMVIDDNALFRQPKLRILSEDDNSLEAQAKKCGLNYVQTNGDVACMGNGAGSITASRDEIFEVSNEEIEPGDFLDVGGGAGPEQIKCALKILYSNIRTKVIFINIYGGLFRVDVFAKILVDFMTIEDRKIPIVLRLEGSNIEEAKEILVASRLSYFVVEDTRRGAEKAVELCRDIPY